MNTTIQKTFALVGKNISYSFSRDYFSKKWEQLGILDTEYIHFDIENISELPIQIQKTSTLKGMNVTIPYKEQIIPFLNFLDKTAELIGAVNTIKILPDGMLKGYNTDYYGFMKSLYPLLKFSHKKALVLGTGGAAKAITFALQKMGIEFLLVSREAKENQINYSEITKEILEEYTIIVNCTPVGTFPNTSFCPSIPYNFLDKRHLLYDLIYNPEKTTFLAKGEAQGATICNGYQMLVYQAEAAWKIWNE
ncbi:MAG: shikimate dehydrogenase [Capnocytophaga sp.]|nr:shikimate dehydrogenase [Capnocytophaga sp.]